MLWLLRVWLGHGAPRGPKRVLAGRRKDSAARTAKKLRRDGGEVTYSAMVSACPNALTNPATGQPVDKKLLFRVFREDIYDDAMNPDDT